MRKQPEDTKTKQPKRNHVGSDNPDFLPLVNSGNELVSTIAGSHLYSFDNDQLRTGEEVDLVESFVQNLQDYADIWGELEAGQRVRAEFDLQTELNNLAQHGFLVFGAKRVQKFKIKTPEKETVEPFTVAVVRIVRKDTPIIIRKDMAVGYDRS